MKTAQVARFQFEKGSTWPLSPIRQSCGDQCNIFLDRTGLHLVTTESRKVECYSKLDPSPGHLPPSREISQISAIYKGSLPLQADFEGLLRILCSWISSIMEYRLWLAGKEQDGNADMWVTVMLTLEPELTILQHSH